MQWPVPKRIRVGPLTNYGYEDSVILLVPVEVPPGPLPAGPQTIIADAEWLVCRVETASLKPVTSHSNSITPAAHPSRPPQPVSCLLQPGHNGQR